MADFTTARTSHRGSRRIESEPERSNHWRREQVPTLRAYIRRAKFTELNKL
jgi:hypothetical protein